MDAAIESHTKVKREIARQLTRGQLVRTARRVLPDDECEDAAHDAVVQALSSSAGFRDGAQVSTWLYRIAFNAALMRRRSARRAGQRLDRARASDAEVLWLGQGSVPSAAPGLEAAEERVQLRQAVMKLPRSYRAVIERCVYAEESPEVVAQALGITPSALRTRFARARDRLRCLLLEESASVDEDADDDNNEEDDDDRDLATSLPMAA